MKDVFLSFLSYCDISYINIGLFPLLFKALYKYSNIKSGNI